MYCFNFFQKITIKRTVQSKNLEAQTAKRTVLIIENLEYIGIQEDDIFSLNSSFRPANVNLNSSFDVI